MFSRDAQSNLNFFTPERKNTGNSLPPNTKPNDIISVAFTVKDIDQFKKDIEKQGCSIHMNMYVNEENVYLGSARIKAGLFADLLENNDNVISYDLGSTVYPCAGRRENPRQKR